MGSWRRTAMSLLAILALSAVFLALLYRPSLPMDVPTSPKKYFEVVVSLNEMAPATIEVLVNTTVVLNITSVGVELVFSVLDYGFSKRVQANETVSGSLLANRPGTFTYQSVVNSPKHLIWSGTLTVTQ